MARGKTKVRFNGGPFGGEVDDNYSTVKAQASVARIDSWARWNGKKVEFLNGERYGDEWIAFRYSVYNKGDKDENGYILYEYQSSSIIERCKARTKSGRRCNNRCPEGVPFCEVHKNMKGKS